MILIAESGSTKCDWILVGTDKVVQVQFQTVGINPMILDSKEIIQILNTQKELFNYKTQITKIHFFGAGCGTVKTDLKIQSIFKDHFKSAKTIDVKGDLDAAVHAATQNAGVVCILGTGSNCCFYDGSKIIQKNPSLGYLLGDEGSGNAIGKALLKAYFNQLMPTTLQDKFEAAFQPKLEEVLIELYQKPFPNKYLAGFARFAIENKEETFIKALLKDEIRKFIDQQLYAYQDELQKYPTHFIGSIAFFTQDIINAEFKERGYLLGEFIKSPIDRLIQL